MAIRILHQLVNQLTFGNCWLSAVVREMLASDHHKSFNSRFFTCDLPNYTSSCTSIGHHFRCSVVCLFLIVGYRSWSTFQVIPSSYPQFLGSRPLSTIACRALLVCNQYLPLGALGVSEGQWSRNTGSSQQECKTLPTISTYWTIMVKQQWDWLHQMVNNGCWSIANQPWYWQKP